MAKHIIALLQGSEQPVINFFTMTIWKVTMLSEHVVKVYLYLIHYLHRYYLLVRQRIVCVPISAWTSWSMFPAEPEIDDSRQTKLLIAPRYTNVEVGPIPHIILTRPSTKKKNKCQTLGKAKARTIQVLPSTDSFILLLHLTMCGCRWDLSAVYTETWIDGT